MMPYWAPYSTAMTRLKFGLRNVNLTALQKHSCSKTAKWLKDRGHNTEADMVIGLSANLPPPVVDHGLVQFVS